MEGADPAGILREAVRTRPTPQLRTVFASYHGYRESGVPPARHRGLPSPFLTMIFTLDEPLQVSQHVDPRQPAESYTAMVGGLHTSPALITHDGAQSGIQLQLSPLGARALLGIPAGELADLDLHAGDLLGEVASRTRDRLQEATTWRQRFAVLDSILQPHLNDEHPAPPEVARAWGRLLRSGGTSRITELAADVGWSERHLARQFRIETGLTPKAAARVIRFHHARTMIQAAHARVALTPEHSEHSDHHANRAGRPELPALSEVAASCGYYDQAHLAREFNSLAGCPPSQWLAEEVTNIQAPPFAEGQAGPHE